MSYHYQAEHYEIEYFYQSEGWPKTVNSTTNYFVSAGAAQDAIDSRQSSDLDKYRVVKVTTTREPVTR